MLMRRLICAGRKQERAQAGTVPSAALPFRSLPAMAGRRAMRLASLSSGVRK